MQLAALVERHPSVLNVPKPYIDTISKMPVVEVVMAVSLPSRCRDSGVTSSGVKSEEQCRLEFDAKWPSKAPNLALRKDFPLNLPHINPHKPGDFVRPCIFAGSVSELMHSDGFFAVIDHLADWLEHAAGGKLMSAEQGWEPVRRNTSYGRVLFNPNEISALAKKDSSVLSIPAYFSYAENTYEVETWLGDAFQISCEEEKNHPVSGFLSGNTVTTIAFPEKKDGDVPIEDRYIPDSVSSYAELIDLAGFYGIDQNALGARLENIVERHKKTTGLEYWPNGIRLVVILVLRRPYKMIGTENHEFEYLPYLIKYSPLPSNASLSGSVVLPLIPAQSISPAVLKKTSGIHNQTIPAFLWLGAGSLGSKVALHLMRSGIDNHIFVDNDLFEAHNLARHALLIPPGANIFPSKSFFMHGSSRLLGLQNTSFEFADIAEYCRDEDYRSRVPDGALLVDSTASYYVSSSIINSDVLEERSDRYCRISTLAEGRAGVLYLEGQNRLPRIDDLFASFYAACADTPSLYEAVRNESLSPSILYGAQNCASVTTVMPDSIISEHASIFARQIQQWSNLGLPKVGVIKVFSTSDDPFDNDSWSISSSVKKIFSSKGWEIRLLSEPASKIDKAARASQPNETGGIVMGHVDAISRCITISGVIDPPADSRSSRSRFILGTQGLRESIEKVTKRSFNYIQMLGTWHSHPVGGGISNIDVDSLKQLSQDANGFPAISLIWSPKGYLVEVQSECNS